jgi:subtilase family serine protease
MRLWRSRYTQSALVLTLLLFSDLGGAAQAPNVRARVTQAVDEQNLVTLRGSTHSLARPQYDRGAAPDDQPLERMLLVLQRGAEQEAALRKLLDEQQIKSSPNYHQWLTPQQFGQQFGPADADIQAVTDWLTSQGFQVDQAAAGRTVIEFSGTAGLVRQALHTEIHKFTVNGEQHWANVSDPQIPAALAPVVAGIASLNNFPRKPLSHRLGTFARSKATGEVRPLFTFPANGGGNYAAVGPTDFATIYNVSPLYQAGIDGIGQTIAIVAQTNINPQDVADFRNMFGLPANAPQIILNGPDPGVVASDEGEADVDVEWAGAVAKNATIKLVVSESTGSTAGIDLSALYIVDNNLAPVLSESYGACEAGLG